MMDRNNLPVGTTVRWLNGGWAEGVIREVVRGAEKVMYLVKPGYGLEMFGGASYTTGWKQSLIGADCIVELGGEVEGQKLSAPNLTYAYGDSLLHFRSELKKLPERVPQDRNMFAEWRKQGRSDKVCVISPDEQAEIDAGRMAAPTFTPAPEPLPVEPTQPSIRVRTRSRPA